MTEEVTENLLIAERKDSLVMVVAVLSNSLITIKSSRAMAVLKSRIGITLPLNLITVRWNQAERQKQLRNRENLYIQSHLLCQALDN
jgi:hypothetical protein